MTDRTRYCKRLIEVDLPIREISTQARREKDMRVGHVPSLHIYPAARPPAACRSVILAALWPDPGDPDCPDRFRHEAAILLRTFRDHRGGPRRDWDNPLEIRAALLDFIAAFSNWDLSAERDYLETSRALVRLAHESLGGTPATRPLVVDPFAGGGAIPLEALRVGADVFATDLNPVSVLLNKVVLEYVPQYGKRLADEVRKWEIWASSRAQAELGTFYGHDGDGSTPIAYLWARTIRCEGPGCGAELPLLRSLWLAKKGRPTALVLASAKDRRSVEFSIVRNPPPRSVQAGTIARGSATCPCCGYTTPVGSVRAQLAVRNGGSDDALLYAVVVDSPSTGRTFRLATSDDLRHFSLAKERLGRESSLSSSLLSELLPPDGALGFRVQKYGMSHWKDLYNSRQLLTLSTYARLCRDYAEGISDRSFGAAVNACLALIVDRLADLNAAMCVWQLNTANTAHVFGRWALPMNWDYGEVNPLAAAGGSPESAIRRLVRCIEDLAAARMGVGHVEQASADKHPLPDDSVAAFITDPPYYDAMPYSDLLDFFYVWLKRSLGGQFHFLTHGELGPKDDECIVDEVKGKDNTYYENAMEKAMSEGRRVLSPFGVGVVVFAHKTTRGWEAQLQAMLNAGFAITASWPIDTEMGSRLRAKGSAALASSVHLVCRPRENPDGSVRSDDIGDWRTVLNELPIRINEWMPRLAREGVVGADAIFACLGPALEVFSRYSRVEKASGEVVTLREYLEQVWAAVAREALSLIFEDADASGFEEDARLTAMWLWTLNSGATPQGLESGVDEEVDEQEEEALKTKGKVSGWALEYDAARKIAQGLGAHLDSLCHLVEVKGDTARLLPVSERSNYLFGKEAFEKRPEAKKGPTVPKLLQLMGGVKEEELAWTDLGHPEPGKTTLDKVHQAMLLFGAGRGDALKWFLVDGSVGKEAQFWKLAQAFSALYPAGSDEKRWVDGVLARKKGLGF